MLPNLAVAMSSATEGIRERILNYQRLVRWLMYGWPVPAPQIVKRAVLARHGLPNATWIETGTFRGETSEFLATSSDINARNVISIEPSPEYFRRSRYRLRRLQNVQLINATSEKAFASLLTAVNGPVNFWLDGHYSAGDTYSGQRDTPILLELDAIGEALDRLGEVLVFVDDVRLFATQHHEIRSETRDGYPKLSQLVNWADFNNLEWTIEHDIFIARRMIM